MRGRVGVWIQWYLTSKTVHILNICQLSFMYSLLAKVNKLLEVASRNPFSVAIKATIIMVKAEIATIQLFKIYFNLLKYVP